MFLLDTNVVSELRTRKKQPSATVRHWAARFPVEQFYLSAVVLLELWLGCELKARTDAPPGGQSQDLDRRAQGRV